MLLNERIFAIMDCFIRLSGTKKRRCVVVLYSKITIKIIIFVDLLRLNKQTNVKKKETSVYVDQQTFLHFTDHTFTMTVNLKFKSMFSLYALYVFVRLIDQTQFVR